MSSKEKKSKKNLHEMWLGLPISNNFIFQAVMRRKDICKKFLEAVLNVEVTDITYPETEKAFKATGPAKGIRLDVYVKETDGAERIFNIEMQTSNPGVMVLVKRVRYYHGNIVISDLQMGTPYRELKEVYVIFICTYNPFKGRNFLIYDFVSICRQDKTLELGDGAHTVFVNCEADLTGVDPELAGVIRYIAGDKPEGELAEAMAQEMEKVKTRPELEEAFMGWFADMEDRTFKAKEEGMEEGIKQGEKKGAFANQLNAIRNLMESLKCSMDDAFKWLKIPVAEQAACRAALM